MPESECGETVVGQGNDHVRLIELTMGESDSGGEIELACKGRGLRNDFQRSRLGSGMRRQKFLFDMEQLGEQPSSAECR